MKKQTFKGLFLFSAFLSLCFLWLPLPSAAELTLPEAIAEAKSKSLALKEAEEMVRAAEANAKVQRTYLYPTFSLGSDYLWREGHTFGAPPTAGSEEGDLADLSFNINQPLYTGGRLKALANTADLAVELARTFYQAENLNLIFQVKDAYYTVLRAEKAVAVAKELVANRQRHLTEVEKRVKVGILPKVEALKAEVELSHSQDMLVSAQNSLDLTVSRLNRLLERPLDAQITLAEVAPPEIEISAINEYYRQAEENRPELVGSSILINQADEGIKVAASGYRPEVVLQLTHQQFRPEVFEGDLRHNNQIMLALSWDIWNWGRTKNSVNAARSQRRQAEISLSSLKEDVRLQVTQAYLSVLSNQTRIGSTQKAIGQAEEALRIQEARFREGLATGTDILDATFALAQARADYYNAIYDLLSAQATLDYAVGRM